MVNCQRRSVWGATHEGEYRDDLHTAGQTVLRRARDMAKRAHVTSAKHAPGERPPAERWS
jgi:hypothetical protein